VDIMACTPTAADSNVDIVQETFDKLKKTFMS